MTPWRYFPLVLLLLPFSAVYALVTALRNFLYDRGILPSFPVPAKVVSVGNLTVGGTGKTPFVEALARFFSEQGHRVAVVSRGYGRRGKKILTVSDGKSFLEDPALTGDEPLLLARHLPGVPVLVGADRVATARKAVESFGSTLILLDDGFQHRRLKRDMDVVTLRRGDPFGNGLVLPAGPLRERRKGLERADVIVLTGVKGSGGLKSGIPFEKSNPDRIVEATYEPMGWRRFSEERHLPRGFLRGKSVFAFSGIGNPASFEATLIGLGVKSAGHRSFPDHHRYTASDWSRIRRRAESLGAEAVVTTEKDAARSRLSWEAAIPLYILIIRLEIAGGKEIMNRVFDRMKIS
jgi:tetraacyldisaccharide 4'-kinase